ncbi:hypothetical protein BBJ28_00019655, partial [Nothophytophthora sp. Chile5]
SVSGGGSTRAFRSGGGSQRPRSRTATPAAILAKPPPTLLRPPNGGGAGQLYDPSPSPASDTGRLGRTSSSSGSEQRESYLRVNTRLSSSSVGAVGRSASPPPPPSDRRSLRASSPGQVKGRLRPPTPSAGVGNLQPLVLPPTSVKLITSQMQFATDLVVKLGPCLELTNFTVVGVLGLDGVGKSTVLSLLAGDPSNGKKTIMFPVQSLESVVLGCHETTGVDLAVTMAGGAGHPTILLDSQPLLSGSMLADLLARNESLRFGALTPEQQVDVASYQLAVFLCAICHYVVVVHDGLASQLPVVELLHRIERKLTTCRLPSVSGGSQKHTARLLFVANGIADSELLYRENEMLTAHERALEAAWPDGFLRVPYPLSLYCEPAEAEANDQHVATFVLPRKQQQSTPSPGKKTKDRTKVASGSSKYEDYEDVAARFRRFMLSLPSSPSFTSPPASSTSMGGKPAPHPLTLREWLSNASRVFEGVRKSSSFTAEYVASRDHH